MRIVKQFDPSLATSGTFDMTLPHGTGRMVIYNESNIGIQLTFQNGFSGFVPAWTIVLYCISGGSSTVGWKQIAVLNTSSNPISTVIVEVYEKEESLLGTFPAALIRNVNIGSTVQTVSGAASSIQNSGIAPLTNWLSVQPSDAGSPTWTGDNSGNLSVNSDNAGTLVTLLQLIAGASPAVKLAAAAVLTEVLGNMKVDGTLESVGAATLDSTLAVTGASTFTGDVTCNGGGNGLSVKNKTSLDNGLITTDSAGNLVVAGSLTAGSIVGNLAAVTLLGGANLPAGRLGVAADGDRLDANGTTSFLKGASSISFQVPNGTSRASVDSGGINLLSGNISLLTGSISRVSKFTGTGSGTFNHGLGTTPDIILCNPCSAGSSSQTIGFAGLTSSQCTVTTGAGLAWQALAIKF
jgi:hypothetical protein